MFAYGLLSVILVLYLVAVGLNKWEVGLLLTLTLFGDTAISLWLTTTADRLGLRCTLMVGALLMALAGIVFLSTGNFFVLVVAATIGVISPSGNDIGPFLSVEQAALSHIVPDDRRTDVFAWYTRRPTSDCSSCEPDRRLNESEWFVGGWSPIPIDTKQPCEPPPLTDELWLVTPSRAF